MHPALHEHATAVAYWTSQVRSKLVKVWSTPVKAGQTLVNTGQALVKLTCCISTDTASCSSGSPALRLLSQALQEQRQQQRRVRKLMRVNTSQKQHHY
jgi:hypothetical protein